MTKTNDFFILSSFCGIPQQPDGALRRVRTGLYNIHLLTRSPACFLPLRLPQLRQLWQLLQLLQLLQLRQLRQLWQLLP